MEDETGALGGIELMRVYFSPCGVGLGHVGRCIPIARRLAQENFEVMFSTYREGVNYVEREKFPLYKAPPIGFQVKPDGTIDFRQTAVNPGPFFASFTLLEQVNAEIAAIENFQPDVVVSDSRASPLLAARILGIPKICILNQFQVIIPRKTHFLRLARIADTITLTVIGRIWTSGNAVLIPDFPEPYTISIGNLNIPRSYRKKVRLIGPILPTDPDELQSEKELRRKLKLPMDRPVIFAPISGPIRERAFLTRILRKILLKFPEKYEIIVSLGYPNASTEPIHHGNVRIYRWVPNRFEYLKACDLVIGRAGHGTLTQCMRHGKPMILVPTPSHTEQLNNAKQAAKIGVAKVIDQEKLSTDKLLDSVEKILKGETPERLKHVQKEVSRYNGLEDAVTTIIETSRTSR